MLLLQKFLISTGQEYGRMLEMGFIRKNKCHQLMVVCKLGPNCPSCLLAAFTVSLTLLHYYIFQND